MLMLCLAMLWYAMLSYSHHTIKIERYRDREIEIEIER